jgi:alpha-mannosidase
VTDIGDEYHIGRRAAELALDLVDRVGHPLMVDPLDQAGHVRLTLVPHTHWDREWYEPFPVFAERLVAMMDTLLDLVADGFPHFHLDGQTAMIDDYLDRRPERADELALRVREGKLSAGPWVTQMDEFLASGESHVRNLRMGLARARELGAEPTVGYLPDQFGHIGQMPRILRDAGIGWALVWRGVPREIERSTFRWQSTDGAAEVLCEYLPYGYSSGATLMEATEPETLARVIEVEVERMRPFMVDDRSLIMVGYDHAGPDATLPERLAAAARFLPGIDARVGSLHDHLERRRLPELPVWRGELRSGARAHLLPNVVSARVHQKLERGRVETLLARYAEPLARSVPGFEEDLRRAWMLLLWNGAHDSACGCSHDQVAADVDARFAMARAFAEGVIQRAMTVLSEREQAAVRFDPSPFEREGVAGPGWAPDPEPEPVPEPVKDSLTTEVGLSGLADGIDADGVLIRFLDEPDVGDLYTFCWAEEGRNASPPDRVHVDGDGFEATWDGLRLTGRVTRRSGEAFFRIEGTIRNDRRDHRLRVHVGLPHPAWRVVAGAPFELVERPLIGEGGEGEVPSSTWPARHVVMASGTAVFNEGVFEYEIFGGHEIAVTLLRSVGSISRETLATRPWPAGPPTPTPNAQMLGDTEFRLGVWPGADAEGLMAAWDRFATELV